MTQVPRLANIGAEEGDWRPFSRHPAVQATAELWHELFEPQPVFSWLDEQAFHAWLNTSEAEELARSWGRPLFGAGASVTRRVHDKAFADRVAKSERLLPEPLAQCIHVLEPQELLDTERALERIDAWIEGWPASFERRFTLKPRLGGSGRGRVARRDALPGALARLAGRGGAVLEPWLRRSIDLSAQMMLSSDGSLTLIGTVELLNSASGVYLGHRGVVDSSGRVASGSSHDSALREAAVRLGEAAAEEGYWGPCGIDAFAYREGGREQFRAAVEFNARFTTGAVALGQLRRLLPRLRSEAGLGPGKPLCFYFGLSPPRGEWPSLDPPGKAYRLAAGAALLVPPTGADIGSGPH